jgi:hypothetical protein|tara:strand:+ start:7361 stop:7549 length:189 start_codon:yes stop_codon:yes gene_type:complete
MADLAEPNRKHLQCVYCHDYFSNTYVFFEHVVSHNIKWKVERDERFVLVDVIQELREERFDN